LREIDQERANMINTETPGLAEQRLAQIRQLLRQRHAVRVEELSAELGVSAPTIRRDLSKLDQRGQVRKVHGGAVGVEGRLDEPVFEDKAAIHAREKQAIAEAALRLIKPEDSIFLDGGSTVLALARLLIDMQPLSVVTNSLRIASLYAGGGPRMILVGGDLRRLSQTFVGALSGPLIDRLHVDTAFMGTIGLSEKEGLTTTDPREAYTKERVMAQARQVVMLADSSKIGAVSFVKFGAPADLDVLITDRGAGPRALRNLKKRGIKTVVRA
jgi:DeoR/GlpR family transcriptional regulator of sugar metabolism